MSVRFLADADLNYAVVVGVRLREPSVDFETANEARLEGLTDSEVLEVAAREERLGEIVESLVIIWSTSHNSDWADQIHYLPSFSRHVFR